MVESSKSNIEYLVIIKPELLLYYANNYDKLLIFNLIKILKNIYFSV